MAPRPVSPLHIPLGELDAFLTTLGPQELKRAIRALERDPRNGARETGRRWSRRLEAEAAEQKRLEELFQLEWSLREEGYSLIAGVDEVGRGALAGPLVAAAVVLDEQEAIADLRDSKLLGAARRQALAREIKARARAWAVGRAEPEEIDRFGIQHANMLAMRRAIDSLELACDYVLVDAFELKGLAMPCLGVIRGDKRSASIAAASVVAKVTRDALMAELALAYPGYGFEHHMGYGCREHFMALDRLGPSAVHRRSFGPCARAGRDRLDLG